MMEIRTRHGLVNVHLRMRVAEQLVNRIRTQKNQTHLAPQRKIHVLNMDFIGSN